MVLLTILAAALFGMIFSLLLAVAAINFKADQTITGTAMNMLATAGATVAVKAMNTAASGGNDVSSDIAYTAAKDLFIVRLGSFEFNWFMLVSVICLAVSFVVLYKTKFGLRLQACGEHPQAADSVGINVYSMRYAGVLISGLLGVLLGGFAGYFGGWADELVMRTVDVFYCIPSTPLLIILGAAMDGMRVDPQVRLLFLMLILGFLGWPGIARLVRGQILSLREQEFMTAAEAAGLSVGRRIFRHLIPNVFPQLIVVCTMRLGSTILTEATLSFLGLGVKFPFASWGNIMNDVSNPHVLTSYWFVWIPAGVCLVLSVLGFNFVGDGLRDAFDPKMKR